MFHLSGLVELSGARTKCPGLGHYLQARRLEKMAREALHFVDEANLLEFVGVCLALGWFDSFCKHNTEKLFLSQANASARRFVKQGTCYSAFSFTY